MVDPIVAEEWRPVVGWEGRYEVSSLGRVRSMKTNKVIHVCIDRRGYAKSLLHKNNKNSRRSNHRMVAIAFIGEPHGDRRNVNHKNGIKTDNRVENLEWVTAKENSVHAFYVLGRKAPPPARGDDHPQAILTSKMVLEARAKRASGQMITVIAKEYGVCTKTMASAIHGRTWSWLAPANHQGEPNHE